MPVANYEIYCQMLDRARERRFAYPAMNVTSQPLVIRYSPPGTVPEHIQ